MIIHIKVRDIDLGADTTLSYDSGHTLTVPEDVSSLIISRVRDIFRRRHDCYVELETDHTQYSWDTTEYPCTAQALIREVHTAWKELVAE